MPTTIIAVRHGETEWNRIGKQQGQLNSDLSELGIRQAHAMADGLKNYRIDLLYTSPLGRAVQTAEIISQQLGIGFQTDPRLQERNLGILQGITKKEFEARFPEEAQKFLSLDSDYRIPKGESIRDRYERSVACAEELHHRHDDAAILIVAHGGILMSFMQKALNLPLTGPRKFSLYNASINIFSISDDNRWRLESWGLIGHLHQHGLETLDDN